MKNILLAMSVLISSCVSHASEEAKAINRNGISLQLPVGWEVLGAGDESFKGIAIYFQGDESQISILIDRVPGEPANTMAEFKAEMKRNAPTVTEEKLDKLADMVGSGTRTVGTTHERGNMECILFYPKNHAQALYIIVLKMGSISSKTNKELDSILDSLRDRSKEKQK
jgi:hypothetical protein